MAHERGVSHSVDCLKRLGGRTRTRTWDPLIKSKILSPVVRRHHTTATDADPFFFIAFQLVS